MNKYQRVIVKDGERYRVLYVLPKMSTFSAEIQFLSTVRIDNARSYSEQELRHLLAEKGMTDSQIGMVLAGLEGVNQPDKRNHETMDQ